MRVLQTHLFTRAAQGQLQDSIGDVWRVTRGKGSLVFLTPFPSCSVPQLEQGLQDVAPALHTGSYLIVEHEGQTWKWYVDRGQLFRQEQLL